MIVVQIDTSLFDGSNNKFVRKEVQKGISHRVITYDILKSDFKEPIRIVKANYEILDIYLLESILYLGKFHNRYYDNFTEIPKFGIKKYISKNKDKDKSIFYNSSDFINYIIEYAEQLKQNAIKKDVWQHYYLIELPFALSLLKLSKRGVALNNNKIDLLYSKIRDAKSKIALALGINNVAGTQLKDINDWIKNYGYDSFYPAYKSELSLNDIKLLKDEHQVFKIFLRYEKFTRIENILESIKGKNTVFPQYNVVGTSTARCTSKNPNIMGVPKLFRSLIIPSLDNYGIVECDYSQMEVGIIAALAQDANLINDFNNSDVYSEVGDFLFFKKNEDTRNKAKVVFLGLLYGLSKNTLAKRLSMTIHDLYNLLQVLFSRYQSLLKYLTEAEQFGKRHGYCVNITRLKRYRNDVSVPVSYWEKNWFKNFPVQASASSVFKKAIIQIASRVDLNNFYLIVPHYDAVVFEAPIIKLKQTTEIVKECMITSMQEYFPKLLPKISINDQDISCWNDKGAKYTIEELIENPLLGIDIHQKKVGNIDWSEYL